MQIRQFVQALAAFSICILVGSAAAQELRVPGTPSEYRMYGESRALLIAVTQYDTDWQPLRPIGGAVQRLEQFLRDHQGFTSVTVLSNPTGAEMREAIRTFLAEAPRDSRALVYFGGHGWSHPETYSGYMVPRDAPSPHTNLAQFRSRSIGTGDMRAFARLSNARHTLFLIDSCMSAALFYSRSTNARAVTPTERPDTIFWDRMALSSVQYLTAGDETQLVPAVSPFVDLFIEGVRTGLGEPGRRFFTSEELGSWMRRRMRNDACYGSALTPQMGQVPHGVVSDSPNFGEMVFIVPDEGENPPPIRVTNGCEPDAPSPTETSFAPRPPHNHSLWGCPRKRLGLRA